MGLLVSFGDQPDFVLSVGGFHPAFKPPPLPFPSPQRISISLLDTSVARIGVQGYFAVTTNTAQFGAKAELFFGFSAISVEGHLGFDALFQFSPFKFVVAISAGVSVKVFGVGLFSVSLDVTLSGPTPWQIKGTASISLLLLLHPGRHRPDLGRGPRHVAAADRACCPCSPPSWPSRRAGGPGSPVGGSPLVNLRALQAAEADVVLHPLGTLFVQQRAVPLDITVDKVGNERSADVSRCSVSVRQRRPGQGRPTRSTTSPWRSSRTSATPRSCPCRRSSPNTPGSSSPPTAPPWPPSGRCGAAPATSRSSSTLPGRQPTSFVTYNPTLFSHFLAGASVARSPLAQAERVLRQPFADAIAVPGDSYVVASTRDNTAAGPVFASHAQARAHLDDLLTADPNRIDELHVIPAMEVAA